MAGLDSLAAVQSRIATIESRLASLGSRRNAPLGDTAGAADFATSLASAQGGAQGIGNLAAGGTWAGAVDDPAAVQSLATKHPEQTKWASDLLARLGMPQTRENLRAMVAWQLAEGTKARFNPLAVNRKHAGATDFNSHGVKNYPSYEAGLEETVAGMHNGLYDEILRALAAGNDASAVGRAVAGSRWGTKDGLLRVLGSGRV